MKNPMLLFSFLALAFALALTACTKNKNGSQTSVTEISKNQLAERGKAIYISNCMACHHADPSKDGAVGPAVSGASKELIEERVIRAAYPKDYKPKRDTRTMVALPHLEKEIPALAAYLSQAG